MHAKVIPPRRPCQRRPREQTVVRPRSDPLSRGRSGKCRRPRTGSREDRRRRAISTPATRPGQGGPRAHQRAGRRRRPDPPGGVQGSSTRTPGCSPGPSCASTDGNPSDRPRPQPGRAGRGSCPWPDGSATRAPTRPSASTAPARSPRRHGREHRVVSAASRTVTATVTLDLGVRLRPDRGGEVGRRHHALAGDGRPAPARSSWGSGGIRVTVTGDGAQVDATGERTTAPRLSWPVEPRPRRGRCHPALAARGRRPERRRRRPDRRDELVRPSGTPPTTAA